MNGSLREAIPLTLARSARSAAAGDFAGVAGFVGVSPNDFALHATTSAPTVKVAAARGAHDARRCFAPVAASTVNAIQALSLGLAVREPV